MIREELETYRREYVGLLVPIERYLADLQEGRQVSPIIPLWNLRLLQDKLRHAEYYSLACVCDEIESRILVMKTDPPAKEVATNLLNLTALLRRGPSELSPNYSAFAVSHALAFTAGTAI